MKESRIDNPFTLIGEYSSKRCSSILDYYMTLSHCQVNVNATNVGADLGPLQKIHRRYLKGSYIRLCTVTNENLVIDNKKDTHL